MEKVRDTTDISAEHCPLGGFVAALPVGAGLRPPVHYRANVYSIMRDTPKCGQKFKEIQALAGLRGVAAVTSASMLGVAAVEPRGGQGAVGAAG